MSNIDPVLFCPACRKKSVYLVDWKFGGLNDSIFNYVADFYECPCCGLVYISNITDEKLRIFYAKECSYFENSHFDISAPENIQKYQYYKKILVNAGLSDVPIVDVGCGRGGFLMWLKNNDWNATCCGIDNDHKSIPDIKTNIHEQDTGIFFQKGTVDLLPFADESQSLLTYFHVLEHIVDLDRLLEEAFRVLDKTGQIMIEVPDAEKYKDFPTGTAFWLGIREHVYHFSPDAIYKVLRRNGFSVASINRNLVPTPEFTYPSLLILAQKSGVKGESSIRSNKSISSFVIRSKKELRAQASQILKFGSNFSSLTFWGCSSELFSLLPIMNLRHIVLCDSSKSKQKCHYKGIPISDPVKVQKNGALIITSYLQGDAIEKSAIKLGWSEEAILRLR
jgi:ubiquinone/menaquinone biosynthesis C-methylase UbiE